MGIYCGFIQMIDFIIQNWWQIILGIVGLIILIVGIIYRKQLKKKFEREVISFTALVLSLGLTLISFITKSTTQTQTLAYINGQRVSLFFPLFWIFIVIFVIALIYFFREELAKEI